MSVAETPLTLGTAGHVDHGKTALVHALTGVDTDRLPEEKRRGLTIALGYAPLLLPSGRRLSVVDVPGHERFVRTMVAGATGIDMFLMVVAADDGVMPQTIEHAAVLQALGVGCGVVAISKCDVADPVAAAEQVAELLPGVTLVPVSAHDREGLGELRDALDAAAAALPGRGGRPGPPRLHVDRVFTVRGRGTVVTGTLWSGTIGAGDELVLQPGGTRVRVRGVQVHERQLARAQAGQRVAVNLAGVRVADVARGDVLAAPEIGLAPTRVLDCRLQLAGARHGQRVQVHHGTRAVAGRLAQLDGELWQLRLEAPLLAQDGDRLVVRRLAPPDTLGGGVVLDAHARRHGPRPELLARLRGTPLPAAPPPAPSEPGEEHPAPGVAPEDLRELERRLLAAGAALLSEAQLQSPPGALAELRAEGVAVRVSGRLYAHADVLADVCERILALIEREGAATIASVRDELGLSRKPAQAFLEHLDARRATRRLPDDRRMIGPRALPGAAA
jgi:selenocysteine-specific elongation factor